MRLWNIPILDKLSGKERCDWINKHNTSKRKFTDNHWKNAGRKGRDGSVLERELLTDKIEELVNDTY